MPESDEFLPAHIRPSGANGSSSSSSEGGWGSWVGFGSTSRSRARASQREDEYEAERREGRVRKTRRMNRDEGARWGAEVGGVPVPVAVPVSASGGATPNRTGPSRATRSQRVNHNTQDPPPYESLD